MRGPRGLAVTRTTSVTRKIRIELTAAEIRKRFRLPDSATIVIRVPGGGDWSNTDLDVTDHPVIVEWTETSGRDG